RLPTGRRLLRAHSQGRETCRSTHPAANQVRAGDQPEDRQGARPRGAADAARPRRRGDRMNRRALIALIGGAAAWPLVARAQQPDRMRRLGVLMNNGEDDAETKAQLGAFRQGLQQLGWSEGRNIHIDTLFAADRPERYQGLAKELVALQPDVLFAYTTPIAAALQRETRTMPIVF